MKTIRYLMLILMLLIPISITKSVAQDHTWYMVTSIVDGDTLRIKMNGKIESVRLFGIDAPERNRNGYYKAAAVLEELCYGKQVRLVYPQRKHRDRYGRLLAEIYLEDGTRVNEELYKRGVVKLYKRSPLKL